MFSPDSQPGSIFKERKQFKKKGEKKKGRPINTQTDGYILSLTSKRNKNINFAVVAKHTAARPECLADTHLSCRKGRKKYLAPALFLFISC